MGVDCAWTARARTLMGVPPLLSQDHLEVNSSPDCAPAAILGQLTAKHEIGLGT